MEIEKKHILKSYITEKNAIEAVQQIKDEMENPIQESSSGYNFEIESKSAFPSDALVGGDNDIDVDSSDDTDAEPIENPDALANNPIDLERPLPERVIHNRIR